jgi:hypothetical protein
MLFLNAHELRDRVESLRRMAREATDEREREALSRPAAETLPKQRNWKRRRMRKQRHSSPDRNSPHKVRFAYD